MVFALYSQMRWQAEKRGRCARPQAIAMGVVANRDANNKVDVNNKVNDNRTTHYSVGDSQQSALIIILAEVLLTENRFDFGTTKRAGTDKDFALILLDDFCGNG